MLPRFRTALILTLSLACAPLTANAAPGNPGKPCPDLLDSLLQGFGMGTIRAPAAARTYSGDDIEFDGAGENGLRQKIIGLANPHADYPFVAARYQSRDPRAQSLTVELVADRQCRLRSIQGQIKVRDGKGELRHARYSVLGASCREVLSDARFSRMKPDELYTPQSTGESRRALELNSRFALFDTIEDAWPMGRVVWLCKKFAGSFSKND